MVRILASTRFPALKKRAVVLHRLLPGIHSRELVLTVFIQRAVPKSDEDSVRFVSRRRIVFGRGL